MSMTFLILFCIVIIFLLWFFFYRFGFHQSNKLIKYILSIISGSGIVLVYLKMSFFSQGYQQIFDMIIIILLTAVFGISLLFAISIDLLLRKK
ncbi:hypothetical protein F9U64_06125 [Gracilibacillus oryzae]|uniref:YesK-like protein n=1 Tax=Gracilibacillus oryzae TaxID=1672701 RepID=A0A7C8GVN6_9BACI|nr:hypothetical protein [Gracilibacillus oryzae]KAB8138203.1 hypothetical protein F9U64_06125 [Gracilibacillus oryzae]